MEYKQAKSNCNKKTLSFIGTAEAMKLIGRRDRNQFFRFVVKNKVPHRRLPNGYYVFEEGELKTWIQSIPHDGQPLSCLNNSKVAVK